MVGRVVGGMIGGVVGDPADVQDPVHRLVDDLRGPLVLGPVERPEGGLLAVIIAVPAEQGPGRHRGQVFVFEKDRDERRNLRGVADASE